MCCTASALFVLTCELQLAQPVVNQRRVLGARPGLLPLVLSPDLMNQPTQRSWPVKDVANEIPGQRADEVQSGGGKQSRQDGQAGL